MHVKLRIEQRCDTIFGIPFHVFVGISNYFQLKTDFSELPHSGINMYDNTVTLAYPAGVADLLRQGGRFRPEHAPEDLDFLQLNIEERHVVGYNLSMADEAYSQAVSSKQPGQTVELLADEIIRFAEVCGTVITRLEQESPECLPPYKEVGLKKQLKK